MRKLLPRKAKKPVVFGTNQNFSPEVWAMIFAKVESAVGTEALLNLRLICKQWRDIIDNHLFIQPKVNDHYCCITRLSHLRVKHCVIQRLTKRLPPKTHLFFRDPALVKTLTLDGPIVRANFIVMLAQFTNLENFNYKKIKINAQGLLTPSSPDEEKTLSKFLGQLKHMELEFAVTSTLLKTDLPPCHNFLLQVMQADMKSLEYLRLSFGSFNLQDSQLLSFLLNHAPNLKRLRIESWKGYENQNIDTLPRNEELGQLHLQKLELYISNTFWKTNWMPIIELQRSLEKLEIKVTSESRIPRSEGTEVLPKFNHLENTLAKNAGTLSSLQLRNIGLSGKLNFCLLQKMDKLKNLKIITCPKSVGRVFYMVPPGRLILTRFYDTRDDGNVSQPVQLARPIVPIKHNIQNRIGTTCNNCGAKHKTSWQYAAHGDVLLYCNPCRDYKTLYNRPRPVNLKRYI